MSPTAKLAPLMALGTKRSGRTVTIPNSTVCMTSKFDGLATPSAIASTSITIAQANSKHWIVAASIGRRNRNSSHADHRTAAKRRPN